MYDLILFILIKTNLSLVARVGSVIPVIATTNSIIVGLVILKSFSILRGEFINNPRERQPNKMIKHDSNCRFISSGSRPLSYANSEPDPNYNICKSKGELSK